VDDLGRARGRRDHHQGIGAGGLGSDAVLHRKVGARGAAIDNHRNASGDVTNHGVRQEIPLRLVELENLGTERNAKAVDARRNVEIDQLLQAVDVYAALLVERSEQDRNDAAVARHRGTDPGEYDLHRAKLPLGRMGVPSDVTNVVVFVASSGADYITGHDFTVNGGRTYA
jgi:hypothetical protein